MPTKKLTVSMPQELYERMGLFTDTNWSALCRKAIDQELRVREAITNNDRVKALREKAKADCADVKAAGLEDALQYPLEKIDYGFLRQLEELSREYVETADPDNLIGVFDRLNRSYREDGNPSFRLRYHDWNYKLSFIEGVLRLKRIADGFDV